ncbi:hypothetical protein GCM10027167_70610 [Nocardia heshunensis]
MWRALTSTWSGSPVRREEHDTSRVREAATVIWKVGRDPVQKRQGKVPSGGLRHELVRPDATGFE